MIKNNPHNEQQKTDFKKYRNNIKQLISTTKSNYYTQKNIKM